MCVYAIYIFSIYMKICNCAEKKTSMCCIVIKQIKSLISRIMFLCTRKMNDYGSWYNEHVCNPWTVTSLYGHHIPYSWNVSGSGYTFGYVTLAPYSWLCETSTECILKMHRLSSHWSEYTSLHYDIFILCCRSFRQVHQKCSRVSLCMVDLYLI